MKYLPHEEMRAALVGERPHTPVTREFVETSVHPSAFPGGMRPEEDVASELSGFQWGWAVQTAAWFLEQPTVANPAIIEVQL